MGKAVGKVLYLDCDGVLANFTLGVCNVLGFTYEEIFINREPKPVPVPINQLYNVPFDEVDRRIGVDFWAELEKFPWADELINFAESIFQDNIIVCTSAGTPGTHFFNNAAIGKGYWFGKYYPKYAKNLVLCNKKHLLAAPNKILVDDIEDNTTPFSAAGGKSIVFPQWWNNRYNLLYTNDWFEIIKKEIEKAALE